MRLILISVTPEVINTSTDLCMETVAIWEADKLIQKFTYSICMAKKDENSTFKVLTLFGVR
ncbi:cytidine/deoxycytidylate deaminase family protein [Priestia aryabhattai]|uniref:hypothetical protein n=1 Tax=Priestia aryabhattai TaxID=412384 RepID=UPI003748D86A